MAVKSTEVIDDISTKIEKNNNELNQKIINVQEYINAEHNYNSSTYLPLIGGKMSGGIVFGQKSETQIKNLPGIGYNGANLILAAPQEESIISFWGSLSEEYGANNIGVTWKKPSVEDNGRVPVFNYGNNSLVWSTYNAGSL